MVVKRTLVGLVVMLVVAPISITDIGTLTLKMLDKNSHPIDMGDRFAAGAISILLVMIVCFASHSIGKALLPKKDEPPPERRHPYC